MLTSPEEKDLGRPDPRKEAIPSPADSDVEEATKHVDDAPKAAFSALDFLASAALLESKTRASTPASMDELADVDEPSPLFIKRSPNPPSFPPSTYIHSYPGYVPMQGNQPAPAPTNPSQKYCPICNLLCRNSIHYRSHIRTHTEYRPFNCAKCDLWFLRKHDLRRHERIHDEIKRWSCEICGKGFSRKDGLKRHMEMADDVKKLRCRPPGAPPLDLMQARPQMVVQAPIPQQMMMMPHHPQPLAMQNMQQQQPQQQAPMAN